MTDAPAIPVAKPRVRWPLSLIVGAVLTAVVVLTALIAFVWTPYDVEAVNIAAKLTAPNAAHPFGTDHFGRDVLSMIMVGARNSIAVALVAVTIGIALGVPLGCWAAARGPRKRWKPGPAPRCSSSATLAWFFCATMKTSRCPWLPPPR